MLLIHPPVNGRGIRVHRQEDVEDTLRTIIALCPPSAQLTLWWYDGEDLNGRMLIGVNGPGNTGGLKYCAEDGDTWIPVNRGPDEVLFSDGHAQLDYEGSVPMETVIAAAFAFAEGVGARPATLEWQEDWRVWDSDEEYARHAP
ncbi:Imm1 family immunity protein [Phytomonospora endophytica]|uniref:Immunity protein Imm1 n=1 Tax=Phytomonospora endophytica TaxID=714109 RepID=A0A841FYA5_9ACTN|nr:Imm1 family immunity protein [Phytomonospora endophytica]MBB6036950.1 hypothetical protein [Phytomonospora endophytica]GIG68019.1 hypothetical protein Pen01_43140 [Phytomonospora endophytica]